MNNSMDIPKKKKKNNLIIELFCTHAISFLGIYTKEMKRYYLSWRYMHIDVHCNIINKSKDMEAN